MTKFLLAGFLLLQIVKHVLGGGPVNSNATVHCFDNSTKSARPVRSKVVNIADFIADLEVIKTKIGALGTFHHSVTDLKGNILLTLNGSECYTKSIVPFLKDNYLVLCGQTAQGNVVLQLDSKGKPLARVNSTSKGEVFGQLAGFAEDKNGNVYFGTLDQSSPFDENVNRTGTIYVVKKPYQTTNFHISSKSISVLARNVDYGGSLVFTDNDQTLLLTSSSGNILKFNLKDYKVTRTTPTLFANMTQLYANTGHKEVGPRASPDIAAAKDSILVSESDIVFVLSQNGKTLLRTISIDSTDANTNLPPQIGSVIADKKGSVNIAFFSPENDSSFVLIIEQSAFGYSSRARQDIVCKVSAPAPPTREEPPLK
ncbi:hypothetical protein HDU81_004750 [Chytriomyces hyalinus]|nr:hypothetical protein HDU81_004750 [Chytriomyces hyalinus]